MKVLVVGGTHGNEWTGITVVTKYAEALKRKFPGINLHFIFANPEAYKINKRFKDEDLNRAFQYLSENRASSYEHHRAKEIKELIEKEPCFVIDLHTTTSNMGSTVIVTQYHPLNLKVASKLVQKIPECRVIGSPDPQKKYLGSQSDLGLMIEVGPVANGVIEPKALKRTLETLEVILTELAAEISETKGELEIFEEVQEVHYPENSFIHSSFQGKDFHPVTGKYTPFETFEGREIHLHCQGEHFPIFINEAAYYPSQLAFILCRKSTLTF